MFLLSASSEKTKTITTTLRLLFYVEILWSQPSTKQAAFFSGSHQRSAIPGIGIEVLTMDPVLVLGIDLSHLEVLVLVLVLGIGY